MTYKEFLLEEGAERLERLSASAAKMVGGFNEKEIELEFTKRFVEAIGVYGILSDKKDDWNPEEVLKEAGLDAEDLMEDMEGYLKQKFRELEEER